MQVAHSLPTTLEAQHLRLEETLSKFRKALDNWRVYSFEYEAFREELQTLPATASREAMLEVGVEIQGTLVDEREIRSLLGDKVGMMRARDQVITAVSHRIEYVDENVKKLQKQVDAAEEKLNQLLIVIEPQAVTEEGLSVMDIQEELDEEGNVTCAWVNGKDPEAEIRALDPNELDRLEKLIEDPKKVAEESSTPTKAQTKTKIAPIEAQTQEKKEPARADDSDVEDKEEEGGGYVRILDDPPEPKEEDWVQEVPGENEEEAKLRKEMLSYNMQEIGAVVAELNLEEDGDFYGYEEYSDEDLEDDDEDTEDEDKYGRTTRRVVSDSYRKQMEELEQRLTGKIPVHKSSASQLGKVLEPVNEKSDGKKGVRFAKELDIAPPPPLLAAVAPPTQIDFAPDENDALPFLEKLLERQDIANAGPILPPVPYPVANVEKPKTKPSLFKKEKLAPSPLRQVATTQSIKESIQRKVKELVDEPVMEPIKETVVPRSALRHSVVERIPGAPTVPIQPPSLPSKKMSRFKAAKAATEESESEGRQQIMSNFVVEHPPSTTTSEAIPPDEMDPAIHRQEVAMQFHKLRSKMIQQQGGFVERDEDRSIVPLNQNGEKQKISRFKAARLRGIDP